MNQMHLQTVLASKAARVVTAAAGRSVVDFGLRRMHGIDAAIKAARAFYIAGVAATSNIAAGRSTAFRWPARWRTAYVQAADNEIAAFRAFARLYPETILLVDTYDTLEGVRQVIGWRASWATPSVYGRCAWIPAISPSCASQARALLDEAGPRARRDLRERQPGRGRDRGACGRGSAHRRLWRRHGDGGLGDAPGLDIAYKLCAYAGRGRLKLSTGKPILPGRKQVFRIEENGRAVRDVITRAEEPEIGRPLLRMVMRGGRRLPRGSVDLQAARRRAQDKLRACPPRSARSGRPSGATRSRSAQRFRPIGIR